MAPKKLEHSAIDHLAATPDIHRALLTGISDQQAYWKPTPERFSIAELLERLSHVEAHYFRHHTDQILASANPEILPYDQNAFYALGTYSNRDAEESLAHWEEQRDDNVELLRSLEPGQLSRTGRHTEVGEFTLGNLLNEWALHDLGHIRQLAELVRAQLYYPGIGPFQKQYSLRP
ncbi:MAG TPA: DinB family protein [Acetobacteraceae bacterium]